MPQASSNRLSQVRGELTNYANAVHATYGKVGQSPYHAYGHLGSVLNAPKVTLQNDIFDYTNEQISDALRQVKDLSVAAEYIDVPAKHPWRETTKTFYSEGNIDEIERLGQSLNEELSVPINHPLTI